MSKKKLSALELKLKKLGLLAKSYTDAKAAADKVYLIEKGTANSGYLKTYILASGVSTENGVTNDNKIGEIDIPKDFLVKSGSVETVTTADAPYTGAQVGDKYIDLVINTVGADETASHVYLPVKDLVDVYTGSNAIQVNGSNEISIILNSTASGLEITANGLAVKLGTATNGLSVTANGLELALATTSSAGAMSAADKTKLDALDQSLMTAAELGSWFGYASDSTMVTTTLPAVSDDSLTDEA